MKVIVTGGAGFIGSAFVWRLNQAGIEDVLIVDALGSTEKWKNLVGLRYTDFLHKDDFLRAVQQDTLGFTADAVVHMGACSATTERNADYLMQNNFQYTRTLADWSLARNARFLYASSAATYGDGMDGFSDTDTVTPGLRPLNMYGYSKHLYDLHALRNGLLNRIVGLKFFNVFGPNEYHKGDMTSVVVKAFHQVEETGVIRLFGSHHPDYANGEQKRDFVYVKDVVETMYWLLENPQVNGLFNVGTGRAQTWNDLAHALFAALGREPKIEYIPMPDALQEKYQYFTQADTDKLRGTGCPVVFQSLETAVADYARNYLAKNSAHLS